MRYSNYFIHTLHEVPKEAEIPSHILLLRGSYIYPTATGIYSILPLGHRVLEKIKDIIRQEMNGIDGIEITMPIMNPNDIWKLSGRYYDIGPELFRLRDRKGREFVLAMTHEEVVTDIAKKFIRSYRNLPVMLYQIQGKIRDEARPRGGLIRLREFIMKDAYSFHPDYDDLDAYYPRVFNAYLRIYARCGLSAVPIEADSGIMGGTGSHEFMLESITGEDRFVSCSECGYLANTEKAVGEKPSLNKLPQRIPEMEKVSTPDVKTISDLMQFFGIGEENFLKTVAYEVDGGLFLIIIRGDFSVSESKLANYVKSADLELASEDKLNAMNLYAGFLSPVGIKDIRIIMDTSVDDQTLFVAGANEPDMHYKNVLYGRDFTASEKTDIAEVRDGDKCSQCREGRLQIHRGIELGHTFKLGTKYTGPDSMDAGFSDKDGKQRPIIMGCYGIGVERLMASAVEQWHDRAGIIWPINIAPFQFILTYVGQAPEVIDAAERIYKRLNSRYEVLYDDRDETAGVKFKDADLLGVPVRILVSRKLLKENQVEIKVRHNGEVIVCPQDDLEKNLEKVVSELKPCLDGLNYMEE